MVCYLVSGARDSEIRVSWCSWKQWPEYPFKTWLVCLRNATSESLAVFCVLMRACDENMNNCQMELVYKLPSTWARLVGAVWHLPFLTVHNGFWADRSQQYQTHLAYIRPARHYFSLLVQRIALHRTRPPSSDLECEMLIVRRVYRLLVGSSTLLLL